MSRQKDSIETKSLKIKMTKDFVEAVEKGGKVAGPKLLEEEFAIGGGSASGIVWCAYRRGARSMPFQTLRSKIKMAVNGGYITKAKADAILNELPLETKNIKPPETDAQEYSFDSRELFVCDISDTANLLSKQIKAYLTIMPENYSKIVEELKSLNLLIQEVTTKNAIEQTEFNLEKPTGYRPRWWH